MALPRHHEAVGGFFSAPQERATYTSFEGGNNVAQPGMIISLLPRAPGQERPWSAAILRLPDHLRQDECHSWQSSPS